MPVMGMSAVLLCWLGKSETNMRGAILMCAVVLILPALAFGQNFEESVAAQARAFFSPLPWRAEQRGIVLSNEKISLGKRLFADTTLSQSKKISCNSCHDLSTYGVDNRATSEGHEGHKGTRNSPTVYNAAIQFAQFWDGRASSVEEQALGPIMNPLEMAMIREVDVIERLKGDPSYVSAFAQAFPGETEVVTLKKIGDALGAFERTLMLPSRFDDFLKGNITALTTRELKGLKTFMDTGCVMCHGGSGLGGKMFQRFGLVKPYPTKDQGRYEITRLEGDRNMFKVPVLRNVEKTWPYFHDGSVVKLEEAVSVMAEYQLGRRTEIGTTADIGEFLKSLTGTIPK